LYGDGRIALRSKAGAPPDNAPGHVSELAPGWPNDLAVPVIATWAEDERFMLDEVEKLNAAGRFAGRLNLDAVGAFGHSFGGASAMQFCKDDARCKAAVNVDGALWGDVALGGLKKPALFLMNDRPILQAPVETLPADARALVEAFNRVRAEVPNKESLIIVKGAAHFNFADASLQSERHVARWIGQIGTADPLEVIETTRKHLRTFFDEHLKKTSAP
jgi:predicted dienelactone hydrolase